ELERSTLNRPLGTMHCPGTTQPRSHHETSDGSCSLVEIGTDGLQRIRTIDTSSVDWKHIEVTVREHTTLTAMLQMLKAELLEQNVGSSDRIWSVHWTLRCSVPVMRELIQEDLAVAVAVELDELKRGTRTIQLLHDVVLIPLEWQLSDANHLAQRYSRLINDDARLIESELKQLIEDDSELSVGWRHRLTALLSGIDAERIFGRMRSDGADWFLPDLEEFETLQRTASPRDISEGASQSEDDEWTDEDFTEEDAVDVLMSDDELSAEEDVPSDDEQFDDDPDFDEEYNNVDPDDDEEDFEDEDDVAGGAA
ncbi:MAG: hypothetical protein KDA91_14905, partial [Planctomycetaceae bacterium]|nr:hypothetical protein [Planctomycetaceae bacterium]